MERGAQAWGFDLSVALVIFIVGLVFFYIFAINYPSAEDDEFNGLLAEAGSIAEAMMSPGDPVNWTSDVDNVKRLGFVTDGRINETKLDEFESLSNDVLGGGYQKTKGLFRIGDEYYYEIVWNVGASQQVLSSGGNPIIGPKNVAKVSRVLIYPVDGGASSKVVVLRVSAWN